MEIGEFLHRRGAGDRIAGLRRDVECVEARLVREICDRLAIGRPGRRALLEARRIGDVARRTLLSCNGQNFPMRLNCYPNAGSRDGHVLNLVAHALNARPHLRQIGVHIDGHNAVFAGCCVEGVDLAELVIDQRAAVAVKRVDVGAFVVEGLGYCPRRWIIFEDRNRAVAAGEEVYVAVDIHRIEVRRILMRNLGRVETGQRGDPDGAGGAAVIVAPRHIKVIIKAERE